MMLLVTSRERLRLSGECVVEVPPLQVPDLADDADVLRRSDAVELFIDRARAAGSHLSLDHDQLEPSPKSVAGSTESRWPLSLPRRGPRWWDRKSSFAGSTAASAS